MTGVQTCALPNCFPVTISTVEIIWGTHTGTDNGRGMAGNVIPNNRGFEMWSGSGPGLMSTNGTILSSSKPSMNFRIYWDGDLEDELLDGTTITKWGVGSIFSAAGCSSNNGTKSTPNLSADLFGDWREEVVFRRFGALFSVAPNLR